MPVFVEKKDTAKPPERVADKAVVGMLGVIPKRDPSVLQALHNFGKLVQANSERDVLNDDILSGREQERGPVVQVNAIHVVISTVGDGLRRAEDLGKGKC